jgi:hypothetical protein
VTDTFRSSHSNDERLSTSAQTHRKLEKKLKVDRVSTELRIAMMELVRTRREISTEQCFCLRGKAPPRDCFAHPVSKAVPRSKFTGAHLSAWDALEAIGDP